MIYVIPAAGKATRFPKEKWGVKPLIRVGEKTLLEYSIRSLGLLSNDFLIVVVLGGHHVGQIKSVMGELGIPCDYEIIVIENVTPGQAATVHEVTSRQSKAAELVIHNCDTALNFAGIPHVLDCAGLIFLFKSDLPQFSYADMDNEGTVIRTAEKEVISTFASTGTYYFESIKTYGNFYKKTSFGSGEHFVAPIYNSMISSGLKIQGRLVQNVFPLGTPSDLLSNESILRDKWIPKW